MLIRKSYKLERCQFRQIILEDKMKRFASSFLPEEAYFFCLFHGMGG